MDHYMPGDTRLLIEKVHEIVVVGFQVFKPLKMLFIESTQGNCSCVDWCTGILGSIMKIIDLNHVNVAGCYRHIRQLW